MRLAIYYPWIYLKGGAERTLVNLLSQSRHEWTLFTNHYDRESTFPEFSALDVVELERVSVRRSILHAGHAAYTLLTQRLPLAEYQGLLVVTESLGNMVTVRSGRTPLFCLCLTPLRVGYDPVIRRRFEGSSRAWTRAAVSLFKHFDRPLWRRYQKVFAISEEVRSRLTESRLVEADRVIVARPGVDLHRYTAAEHADPFFLLPGRIMWTKQVELGIDAFSLLKQTEPGAAGFRLVIAGMVDRKSRPYLTALQDRAASLGDAVEFVECPSDDELQDLYARSYATLFTAYNEDWGLVPLESMAASKPVIAVDRGGPRETIVHEHTGFLVASDPSAFAQAMSRLIRQPGLARRMGYAGRGRAADFPWSLFARDIDNGIEEALLSDTGALRPVSAGNQLRIGGTASRVAQPGAPRQALQYVPPRLWIYTNYDCNLSCSYCVARSSPRAPRRSIDLPVFEKLIDEAVELGVREVFLTGGEPFLLPDIFERVLYAGSRLRTIVLTNGMLLTGRRAQRLVALSGSDVAFQVTIDGASASAHEAYRGKNSWAKAVQGIATLKENGLTVYVGSTETPANAGELEELRRFVQELGVSPEHHYIRPLARRGHSQEGKHLSVENLEPELTVNRDGVFWHPFGTDDDLLLTPEIFPLREAFDLLAHRYQRVLAGGNVPERYRCAVV